mmetsp:Transcript_35610/g.80179  ORF Transcript_35610/g.80179 Transcript_35610/m.80179 type:complete len:246 (-) Transcript_35610:293-1030(-)
MRHLVIVLVRHASHVRQVLAAYVAEVVVLIVIAHVEREPIQRTIVAVRLLTPVHHVVLRNEMSRDRMEAHAEQCAHDQVHELPESPDVYNRRIECNRARYVDKLPLGRLFGIDEQWPQRVERRLKEAPENFLCPTIKEPALPLGRYVNVDNVLALELVVLQVVPLEAAGRRYAHGQVREDGKESIGRHALGAQVVAKLVHCQSHHVVDRPRYRVAAKQPGVPRRALEEMQRKQLDCHPEKDLVLG